MRHLIDAGLSAVLLGWTTFGIISAAATVQLWMRLRARGDRAGVSATVLSAIAAAPSLVFSIDLGIDLTRALSTGRPVAGNALFALGMRYWILLGGAILVWSSFELSWRAGKGPINLVRACHAFLWALASGLILLALWLEP